MSIMLPRPWARAVPRRCFSSKFSSLFTSTPDQPSLSKTPYQYNQFQELGEFNRMDGKVLPTSKTIMMPGSESLAQFPPSFPCESLHHPDVPVNLTETFLKEPVTLVTISFRQHGHDSVKEWISAVTKEHPELPTTSLCLAEEWYLRYFRRHIRQGLVTAVANSNVNTFLHFGSSPEGFRQTLDLRNTFSGYVFLVDRLARIRWRASGKIVEVEEIQSLLQSVQDLTLEANKSTS